MMVRSYPICLVGSERCTNNLRCVLLMILESKGHVYLYNMAEKTDYILAYVFIWCSTKCHKWGYIGKKLQSKIQ